MSRLVPYICEQLSGVQINCILDDGEPWFKTTDSDGSEIHRHTDNAIRRHVADDDKRQQVSFDLNPAFSRGGIMTPEQSDPQQRKRD